MIGHLLRYGLFTIRNAISVQVDMKYTGWFRQPSPGHGGMIPEPFGVWHKALQNFLSSCLFVPDSKVNFLPLASWHGEHRRKILTLDKASSEACRRGHDRSTLLEQVFPNRGQHSEGAEPMQRCAWRIYDSDVYTLAGWQ